MIKVSVIIPSFKPAEYIFKCLDSLCQQSLNHSYFEIIIVLNGVREPYYENLFSFLTQNENLNFQILFNEVSGVSSARNMGLAASSGDYVCFVDDDDYISTNYLESLLNSVQNNTVVASNVVSFDDCTGEHRDDYLSTAYSKVKFIQYDVILYRSFLSSCWGKILPKSVIRDSSFDPDVFLGEDALFMFTVSKNISRIELSEPNVIYYRRVRKNSASRFSRPLGELLSQRIKLIIKYSRVYFNLPLKYSFKLYLTRIFATIQNMFR